LGAAILRIGRIVQAEYDKAVQLYHKGGDIPRALDLCFRIGEEEDKINT
jgi:hypothetical protein